MRDSMLDRQFGKGAFLCFLILFFFMQGAPCEAWYQDVHEAMNSRSIEMFFAQWHRGEKYANDSNAPRAPIQQGHQYLYLGPEVRSYTQFQNVAWSYHVVEVSENTFPGWVSHGGYSADEPHLWASVRHFYDPLRVAGSSELTDHKSLALHKTP